jgi:hypothetical protein
MYPALRPVKEYKNIREMERREIYGRKHKEINIYMFREGVVKY